MEQRVNVIKPLPKIQSAKKVAAYARVSNGKDAMLHSLSVQVSYYSEYIQNQKGWKYAGVYFDEAISGTKENRVNFQRMIEDCRLGKIDMILTKSISRFSRNTAVLLTTIRELKELGVDVFFEEQNIHSMSADGELMLTILASYAQEEARSVSENMLWRVRNNFVNGKVFSKTILGYRIENSTLVVVKEEAEIVRRIFKLYLEGCGIGKIAKILNEEGQKSRLENRFSQSTIFHILRNQDYTGDLLLQKTYRRDYLIKKPTLNKGQKDSYLVENSHEAIIDKEMFDRVQKEIVRRSAQHPNSEKRAEHLFSKFIVCGQCGATLIRGKTGKTYSYRCPTYRLQGKRICNARNVPELEIISLTRQALGRGGLNRNLITKNVQKIISYPDQTLEFVLIEGDTVIKHWNVPSRRDSWTDEMKLKASELSKQKSNERKKKNAKNTSNTGND